MAKIFNIQDLRKRVSSINTSVFLDQAVPYADFFENKRILLAEIMRVVYDVIMDANLDPDNFRIDSTSMEAYKASSFDPNAAGDEMEGPSFNCYMHGNLYCVITRVEIHEDQELFFIAEPYMISNYDDGNREWLAYSFALNDWTQGPGVGFFDPKEILRNSNAPVSV